MERLTEYNPEISFAEQKVRVTFMAWDYSVVKEAIVVGNCRGMTILDSAIERIYDDLPTIPYYDEGARLVMHNPKGDELECDDDEMRGYDWLKDMAVSAEIVTHEKEIRTNNRTEKAE